MKVMTMVLAGVLVCAPAVIWAEDKAEVKQEAAQDAAKPGSARIEKGKKVTLEYVLTVDGAVVDKSSPDKPFQYTQGANTVIKGLETALEGLKAGDTKKITIEPKDAYGDVNPEAFMQFPKSKVPQGVELKKGQVIGLTNDKQQKIKGIVWDFKDDKIILNMNHPLAGKTLNFDVKVVSVE